MPEDFHYDRVTPDPHPIKLFVITLVINHPMAVDTMDQWMIRVGETLQLMFVDMRTQLKVERLTWLSYNLTSPFLLSHSSG